MISMQPIDQDTVSHNSIIMNIRRVFLYICMAVVICTVLTGTGSAIYFCADVLEQRNSGGQSGLKTFDPEWVLGVDRELVVDVWIGGSPEPLLTTGVQVLFDQSRLAIEDVAAYDDIDLPGPWDYLMTRKAMNPRGPGYLFACGNLSGTQPDGCGDVLIARITFRCTAPGETLIKLATIPDFDSVVGYSGTLYDHQMAIPPFSLFPISPLTSMTGYYPCKPRNAGFADFPACFITIE